MKKVVLWACFLGFMALTMFFVVGLNTEQIVIGKAISRASLFALIPAVFILFLSSRPTNVHSFVPALVATAMAAIVFACGGNTFLVVVLAITVAFVTAIAGVKIGGLPFWRTFVICTVEGMSLGLAMTLFRIDLLSGGIGLAGIILIFVFWQVCEWYDKWHTLIVDP